MKAKLKGRKPWNKGVPQSDEAKQKNRITHTGKRHSQETKKLMSKAHKGIVHDGMFKKGQTPWNRGRNVARKIEKSLLRDFILERDKCCKVCGTPEAKEIHHIRPWHISKDNSPENLVLLCKSCHLSLHQAQRFGRPYNKDLLKVD
jgi:hypothetical protein